MIYRIVLSPDAESECQSALGWYALEDIELALRFTAAIDAILRRIAETPYAFPRVKNSTQRAVLKRFPYSVYFIVTVDLIRVISVLHHRRAETHWQRRSNGYK